MQPVSPSEESVVTPVEEPFAALSPEQVEEILRDHHFVFLGGLHRSGTTLLFRMLREHPAVSGFENNKVREEWLAPEDEGQFLQTVYPPAVFFGGPGKFAFAPEAHMTEESDLLTPENKTLLPKQWFPFWDLTKRYLLEKSPPNLIWMRFLQSVFPNSSYVAIERHPVAVSLATEKWSSTSLPSLIEHWLVAHETFESDRPRLKHNMVVKYEKMVSDPAGTLPVIYEFLGLPTHGTTFEPTTEHNQRYFAKWQDLAQKPDSGPVIEECIGRFEARVGAFGYSLRDLEKL
jgi:Sulfotransferase family